MLLLDLGCGTGLSTRLLKQLGLNVLGLDVSLSNLRSNGTPPYGMFVCGDLMSLPFGDSTFDVVAMNNVVEYFCDVDIGFAEIARVTKPQGMLILRAPNLLSPVRTIQALSKKQYSKAPAPYKGRNAIESIMVLVRNLVLLLFKQLTRAPRPTYRTPTLDNSYGAYGQDYDSVFYSNPRDVLRVADSVGFKALTVRLYNFDSYETADLRRALDGFTSKFPLFSRKMNMVFQLKGGSQQW